MRTYELVFIVDPRVSDEDVVTLEKFVAYASAKGRALVDRELYLPER